MGYALGRVEDTHDANDEAFEGNPLHYRALVRARVGCFSMFLKARARVRARPLKGGQRRGQRRKSDAT